MTPERSPERSLNIYFQYITDADGLKQACGELQNTAFIGFDTETTELDPYRGELRLVQLSDGRNTQVIDLKPFAARGDLRTMEELAPLRDLISDTSRVKIAHNAKFDAKWVRHHLGAELNGVFDTFLASQLISAGDQDRRHSLADIFMPVFWLAVESGLQCMFAIRQRPTEIDAEHANAVALECVGRIF